MRLPLAIPAPTFRHVPMLAAGQSVDLDLTSDYAASFPRDWALPVVVAGPMGRGEQCTPTERKALFEVWAQIYGAELVIAACWTRADLAVAAGLGVTPLIMLRSQTDEQLLDTLGRIPPNGIAYANPRYSDARITPQILRTARDRGIELGGVKLSKVTLDELAAVRQAAPDALLIHGSSRNIAGSLAAGADVVVAPPLAIRPHPWPNAVLSTVQMMVDGIQISIDANPDHDTRVSWITSMALGWLHGTHH